MRNSILYCGTFLLQKSKQVDVASCSTDACGTSMAVYHYHNFHIFSVVRQIDRCVASPWQTTVKIHIAVLQELNLPSPAGINYSIQTVALGDFFFFFFFFLPPNMSGVCWVHGKLLLAQDTRTVCVSCFCGFYTHGMLLDFVGFYVCVPCNFNVRVSVQEG